MLQYPGLLGTSTPGNRGCRSSKARQGIHFWSAFSHWTPEPHDYSFFLKLRRMSFLFEICFWLWTCWTIWAFTSPMKFSVRSSFRRLSQPPSPSTTWLPHVIVSVRTTSFSHTLQRAKVLHASIVTSIAFIARLMYSRHFSRWRFSILVMALSCKLWFVLQPQIMFSFPIWRVKGFHPISSESYNHVVT